LCHLLWETWAVLVGVHWNLGSAAASSSNAQHPAVLIPRHTWTAMVNATKNKRMAESVRKPNFGDLHNMNDTFDAESRSSLSVRLDWIFKTLDSVSRSIVRALGPVFFSCNLQDRCYFLKYLR